jgi:hypothetical protein
MKQVLVTGAKFSVQGSGFRVQGLGFRVWGTQKAHKLFKSLARGVETAYSVSTLSRLETLNHEILISEIRRTRSVYEK